MRAPSKLRLAVLGTLVVVGALVVGLLTTRGSHAPEAPHVAAPVSAVPGSTDHRPNVMVVMLDDMRSDEMRFAPNARKYVRDRGLDFRNSFSPYPLCCPARASFLLGQYAHNHGVLYHEAPYGFGAMDDRLTIAGRLQDAGYSTALIGKYLNNYGNMPSKVTGGPSEHYIPAGWTDWMAGLEKRWKRGSGIHGGTYHYFDLTQNINGKTVQHPGEYSSNVIGTQVRGLIRKYHQRGKPFFMWVTPPAPHRGLPVEKGDPRPYRIADGRRLTYGTPARPWWVKGRFDAQITHAPGVRANGKPSEPDISDKALTVRSLPEAAPQEKLNLRSAERQRAEAIYAWDVQFGNIIRQLKKSGEYSNTVIMFTSDNGYYVGEHRQRLGKIKAYEPVIHVPLAVAGSGIERGVRYAPITTFDLTATILDLAGARPLPRMDGSSKVAEMTGPDVGWNVPMVTEGLLVGVRRVPGSGVPTGLTTSGIRTGRWKLIRYSTGEGELYDLLTDPNELTSQWKNPAYADIRRQMVALWAEYRTCKEAGCRTPMPASLVEGPGFLARQYAAAVRKQIAYYGK